MNQRQYTHVRKEDLIEKRREPHVCLAPHCSPVRLLPSMEKILRELGERTERLMARMPFEALALAVRSFKNWGHGDEFIFPQNTAQIVNDPAPPVSTTRAASAIDAPGLVPVALRVGKKLREGRQY